MTCRQLLWRGGRYLRQLDLTYQWPHSRPLGRSIHGGRVFRLAAVIHGKYRLACGKIFPELGKFRLGAVFIGARVGNVPAVDIAPPGIGDPSNPGILDPQAIDGFEVARRFICRESRGLLAQDSRPVLAPHCLGGGS